MFWIQALLSRADLKVKELRQSMDRLKAESDKLEVSLFSYFKSLFLLQYEHLVRSISRLSVCYNSRMSGV